MMKTMTICSASTGSSFTKPARLNLPLVPVFGARSGDAQHVQRMAAFSLDAEHFAQGPFSFIADRLPGAQRKTSPPDVPKTAAKPEVARAPRPVVALKPDEEPEVTPASPGKPRFRSALEQVSYLTNESAAKYM